MAETIDIEKFRKEANDKINGRLSFRGWIGSMLEMGGHWAKNLILPGDSEDAFMDWLEGEKAEENAGYIINSFGLFISQIYATPELRKLFPEFSKAIDNASAYLDNPSINDIALELYGIAFSPLSTSGGKYVSKDSYALLSEYMDGINSGYITLFLSPPAGEKGSIDTIQQLYELLPDPKRPFADLNLQPRIDLATIKYCIDNGDACLFYVFQNPEFLKKYKVELQSIFGLYNTLSLVNLCYTTTDETVKLYFNESTNELEEHDNGGTSVTILKPTKTAGKIAEIGIYYKLDPNGNSDILQTAKDSKGEILSNVVFSDASDTFIGSRLFKNVEIERSELLTFDFSADYYKKNSGYLNPSTWFQVTLESKYTVDGKNGGALGGRFVNQYYNAEWLQKYENEQGIMCDYIVKNSSPDGETSSRPPEKTLIDENYKSSYDKGGVTITDTNNGDMVYVPGLSDDELRGVLEGDANITDVMAGKGNYAIDKETGNVIKTEGSTDNSKPDEPKVDSPIYNYTIPSGLVTTYVLTASNLRALGSELYDPGIVDIIKKIFSDPMQSIVNVGFLPFQIPNLSSASVKIGGYQSNVTAYKASSQYLRVNYGRLGKPGGMERGPIGDQYEEYRIYVPYCGWHPIPASYAHHDLYIDAWIDIITGDMSAGLYANVSGRMLLIDHYTGNCMRSIPLSASSGNAMLNFAAKAVGGVVSTGATVANPIAGMVTQGIVSSMTSQSIAPTVTTVGGVGGNIGIMGPQRPVLVGRKKQYVPSAYGNNRTIGKYINLSQLYNSGNIGQVKVANLDLVNVYGSDITTTEIDKLRAVLAQGVALKA